MNKMAVIIGLVLTLIGALIMAVGWSMSDTASAKVAECNTDSGQLKRILDPDYKKECDEAAALSNTFAGICIAGLPMLIIGIIVLIYGAVKKDKPAQPAYPPVAYPQQYPPQQPQYQPQPYAQPPPPQYIPPPQYPPQQQPPQYPPPPY